MSSFYFGRFGSTPKAVKNIIIINVAAYLLCLFFYYTRHIDLHDYFALYFFKSEHFHFWQYLTYMFMHAYVNPATNRPEIYHILFNMFGLWMFGKALEGVWGSKRFWYYYIITGVGAAALQTLVYYIELRPLLNDAHALINTPTPALFKDFILNHVSNPNNQIDGFVKTWSENPNNQELINNAKTMIQDYEQTVINIPTVGASGAVFGVLLAFGMLFPNVEIIMLFLPIPIKAKYFVVFYGLLELFFGITGIEKGVAHFAHIGGMLFGFVLIKYWNKFNRKSFY